MKFFIAFALFAVVAARPNVSVGPAIVDSFLPESAAPSSSLVQIIVNVKDPGNSLGPNPVVVEGLDRPEPLPKPTPVIVAEEAAPEPVIVVDNIHFPDNPVVPEPVIVTPAPEPVIVVPEIVAPEPVVPEPVVVAPVIVAPVVSIPETLN